MNTIQLRTIAVAIDLSFLGLAVVVFRELLPLLYSGFSSPVAGPGAAGEAALMGASALSALGFYGVCGGAMRRSPGKRLAGLDVISIKGGAAPGFFRAMLREQMRVVEILSIFSAFFSYLNILENRPTQTDVLFQTFVRDRRRLSSGSSESRVLGM